MRKRIDFILTWKRIGAAAAAGVVAAFALGWSGMVPISASSGHFPPFGWFLHWVMGNAAEKQSLAVSVPDDLDLSDPALVKRGAGHFATGCAVCHGSPTEAQSPVVLSMTPHPPRLEGRVPEWSDRELFWIVQHGIKYTGMPAWPTQARADEVWAQVAFLRALPGMSPAAYDDLALASGADGELDGGNGAQNAILSNGAELAFEDALADCARCHGRDGYGRGPAGAFPVLAGQPADYLLASLQAYSNGERASGFMQPPARRYDAEMLARLAEHFAGVEGPGSPAATGGVGTDAAAATPPAEAPKTETERAVPKEAASGPPDTREGLLALGRRLAEDGLPERKLPACESCHGADGANREPARNAVYPRLAGQPEWYLKTQLHLWKEGERGGTAYAHVMTNIAKHLTEEQIEAAAAWYGQTAPGDGRHQEIRP
ncbi:MAG: cytochrome C [Aurantimonas sp.]|nr:cytochrome C [Aurantimonas sp.]